MIRHTDLPTDQLTGWPTGRLTDWPIDRSNLLNLVWKFPKKKNFSEEPVMDRKAYDTYEHGMMLTISNVLFY